MANKNIEENSDAASDASAASGPIFVVERILSERAYSLDGEKRMEYLIQWMDYGMHE